MLPQGMGMAWKFNINHIRDSLADIRAFPETNTLFLGNTLIVKAAKSTFVRSLHLPAIKTRFPNYTLATVRDAGHWVHAEKPQQTVDIIARFLNSMSE